jgi:hypothetical protein
MGSSVTICDYKRIKNDIGRILAGLEAELVRYPGDEDLVNAEDWPRACAGAEA